MSSEWPLVAIEDVCSLIVDCVNKTAPVTAERTPYRMIRTTNVRNGRIDLTECRHVERETYEKWTRRAELKLGDVILTREAPIGEVGFVTEYEGVFLGQRLMQYRADPNKLDPRFLLYSFLSPDLQHQFGSHEGSGSVVSHIRVGDCFKFKLRLPPLKVQSEIGAFLRALDDRIALLRETNTTLEAIAQALFKSWFVDFDPVHANAAFLENGQTPSLPVEIQALFPSRLVESPQGLIPEGWEVCKVEDLLELAYGKALKATDRIDGDVPVYGSGGITGSHNQALVEPPSIIVGRKGTVGTLYWEDRSFFPIDTVFYVKTEKSLVYCFYLLQTLGLKDMNTDGAVPGLNRNNVYRLPVVIPSEAVLKAFNEAVVTVREKIFTNNQQTDSLINLRDTLLPRLISGQLRLPEAEAVLAEQSA
ncbi:MAG: restriction endonuclease subunit S [Paraglaciecola sp.]|nr:restriction endonuclease subunit S [Paraglaciecola sp.]